jgi:hypothetical protein
MKKDKERGHPQGEHLQREAEITTSHITIIPGYQLKKQSLRDDVKNSKATYTIYVVPIKPISL